MSAAILNVRDDFPCLEQAVNGTRLAYLDSAATALKPKRVIEALTQHYAYESANIHRGVHALSEQATAAFELARETVRSHINAASTREVIFTSGATDGINLVARAFGDAFVGPGDEILITQMEHHSNIVPWQQLCQRTGARLRAAPMDEDGNLDRQAFSSMLTNRTRLVAITALSNALGTVNPIKQLTREAQAVGARVLIDAAQAIPVQAINVRCLGCDFLVFSGHKTFGPTGIGVLYGKEEVLERMPPFKGGGDMILSVTIENTRYNELPYKFEAGTPHIAGAIGLAAALDYINEIGYDRMAAHETELIDYAVDQLRMLPGVRIIGNPDRRRAIVSFVVDDIHPHDLGTILDGEGVAVRAGHHCAQPAIEHFGVTATVRASFSIYNQRDDVYKLISAVRKTQKVFA
jgi:cysteine desulfurase/selenocysteine lyase